jgi:hypothetical protein
MCYAGVMSRENKPPSLWNTKKLSERKAQTRNANIAYMVAVHRRRIEKAISKLAEYKVRTELPEDLEEILIAKATEAADEKARKVREAEEESQAKSP